MDVKDINERYDLSARIARLKTQKFCQADLIPILEMRFGIKIAPSLLSSYILGRRKGDSAKLILSKCNEIVSEIEKKGSGINAESFNATN